MLNYDEWGGGSFFEDIYTFLTSFSLSSSTGGILLSGMLIICCENTLQSPQNHSSHKELFHTWAEALRGIAQQSPYQETRLPNVLTTLTPGPERRKSVWAKEP